MQIFACASIEIYFSALNGPTNNLVGELLSTLFTSLKISFRKCVHYLSPSLRSVFILSCLLFLTSRLICCCILRLSGFPNLYGLDVYNHLRLVSIGVSKQLDLCKASNLFQEEGLLPFPQCFIVATKADLLATPMRSRQ